MLALLFLAALLAGNPVNVAARTVNISSTWFLPQEGFPVFYRYFRDRITWFEADAVCQFHHANLVTVDTSVQFDTTRAYLKELDVVQNVWIGLKKSSPTEKWAWTDYKPLTPTPDGGYWVEQIPKTSGSLCATIDPAADFRWHSLNCGGPEVASFICELPVPPWARKEDGCMLTALPSLTVTFLPEQAAVELTSDCGLDGTRRIACKGEANRDDMVKQLSCDTGGMSQEDEDVVSSSSSSSSSSSTPGAASISVSSVSSVSSISSSVSSSSVVSGSPRTAGTRAWSWTAEPPTRHRRDADDLASSSLLPINTGSTIAVSESAVYTTTSTYDSLSTRSHEVSTHDTSPFFTETITHSEHPLSTVHQNKEHPSTETIINHEDSYTYQPSTVGPTTLWPPVETIPPFNNDQVDLIMNQQLQELGDSMNTIQLNQLDKEIMNTNNNAQSTSVPLISSQSLTPGNSNPVTSTDSVLPINITNINTNPNINSPTQASQINTTEVEEVTPTIIKENITTSTVISDHTTLVTVVTNTTNSTSDESKLVVNEQMKTEKDDEENRRRQFLPTPLRGIPSSKENTSTTRAPVDWVPVIEEEGEAMEEEPEEPVEQEPEIPARPNRGRRLTRPQGHSFYPYFLNRVLG